MWPCGRQKYALPALPREIRCFPLRTFVLQYEAAATKKGPREGTHLRAEDGIRTRGPLLGKQVRYRCATSAGENK